MASHGSNKEIKYGYSTNIIGVANYRKVNVQARGENVPAEEAETSEWAEAEAEEGGER